MSETVAPPKSLPQPQVQPSQMQSQPKSAHQFKSTANILKEQLAQQVTVVNKGQFTVDPNTSLLVTVDYKHTYISEPMIFYTLICADNEFGLNHYLNKVGTSNCIIAIENTIDKPRQISVVYRIASN